MKQDGTDGAETPSYAFVRRRPQSVEEGLGKARAMTTVLTRQADELRAKGDVLLRRADKAVALRAAI
jgi:hypothetical protein